MKFAELVLIAYQNSSLIPVLMGEYPYTLEQSQYVPGLLPTDVDRVLKEGIYEVYKGNKEIKNTLEDEIKNMLDMEMEYVYMSLSYIFSQVFNENHKLSPFNMNKEVIQKATMIIKIRKSEMDEEIEFWNGTKMNGIWSEIKRMDKVLRLKYNTQIIEDTN